MLPITIRSAHCVTTIKRCFTTAWKQFSTSWTAQLYWAQNLPTEIELFSFWWDFFFKLAFSVDFCLFLIVWPNFLFCFWVLVHMLLGSILFSRVWFLQLLPSNHHLPKRWPGSVLGMQLNASLCFRPSLKRFDLRLSFCLKYTACGTLNYFNQKSIF